MVLRWGQIFALSFNLGLILGFWLALLVSDRTFAWSSTLSFSNSAVYNLLHSLALPWSWILIERGVSPALVSDTRLQSLQTQFSPAQVETMRTWWPFLLCALITYGLLPRIILYAVFSFSFKRQLKHSMLHYPGVPLALDRPNSPIVSTQTLTCDPINVVDKGTENAVNNHIGGDIWLINWCGAYHTTGLSIPGDPGISPVSILSAGLRLNEDAQVIDKVNHEKPGIIVIAIKSWEPPLAELTDFIAAISAEVQCALLLNPLHNKSVSVEEWNDWQHFCRHKLSRPIQLMRADEGRSE